MTESNKKIIPIQGVIIKATQETPDTWTLNIFVDQAHRNYLAGQFVTIDPHQFFELRDIINFFEYQKGKPEQVRAYSLASAPHEPNLLLTIKPEPYFPAPGSFPPILSPLLASDLLVGREIKLNGYAGAFIMPTDLSKTCDHAVHLAAGSGIVPSYAIIKDQLVNNKNKHIKHTLVFVNKTFQDIIFYHNLEKLAQKYHDRFNIKYFLTRDHEFKKFGANFIQGRPTITHIEHIINNNNKTLFFACGPAITKWQKKRARDLNHDLKPRFMEWVQDTITKLKIDKKLYKREVYG